MLAGLGGEGKEKGFNRRHAKSLYCLEAGSRREYAMGGRLKRGRTTKERPEDSTSVLLRKTILETRKALH